MFKFIAIIALASFANAGYIPASHTLVHEPVLTKVGEVVHSAPSAVSHQSITQVHHGHHVVSPVLAHAVKSTLHSAPVYHHAAPVVHSAPVYHELHSAALVNTIHSNARLVHAEPLQYHTVHSAPHVHSDHYVKSYLH